MGWRKGSLRTLTVKKAGQPVGKRTVSVRSTSVKPSSLWKPRKTK